MMAGIRLSVRAETFEDIDRWHGEVLTLLNGPYRLEECGVDGDELYAVLIPL